MRARKSIVMNVEAEIPSRTSETAAAWAPVMSTTEPAGTLQVPIISEVWDITVTTNSFEHKMI